VGNGGNTEEDGCCQSSQVSFLTDSHHETFLFSRLSGVILSHEGERWCDGKDAIRCDQPRFPIWISPMCSSTAEILACVGNYMWMPKADYLLARRAVIQHFEAYWLP
jgi:hypothetical protein